MKYNNKIDESFYNVDALTLAKNLLGKTLVHKINDKILKAKIVETEAYIGLTDKACHAYGGKKTPRVEPLYAKAGTAYVYLIYGMYYCFNIVSGKEGEAEAVLIRGVEPLDGIEEMVKLRYNKKLAELTTAQYKNLCNGPGKLCNAMNINKSHNYLNLIQSNILYLEEVTTSENIEIISSKRIGIDYAEEARDFLWRFYIKDNTWVSKTK